MYMYMHQHPPVFLFTCNHLRIYLSYFIDLCNTMLCYAILCCAIVIKVPAMNTTAFSGGLTENVIGWLQFNANEMAKTKPRFPFLDFKGEDPRLFLFGKNYDLYVSFARRFKQLPEIRMAQVKIELDGLEDSDLHYEDIVGK